MACVFGASLLAWFTVFEFAFVHSDYTTCQITRIFFVGAQDGRYLRACRGRTECGRRLLCVND